MYVGAMGFSILVVDDEACVRALVGRLLKREGFEVLEAAHGREALQLAKTRRIDLMVLDFGLPGLSGDKVYKALRENPKSQALPILILTGLATPGLSSRCLNEGADAFLA